MLHPTIIVTVILVTVLHSNSLQELTVVHVVHLAELIWLGGLSGLRGLG